MPTLVTGASGIAGRAVCALLSGRGEMVRAADVMPPAGGFGPGIEFVRCDTRTPDDVRRAFEGCDAVVHLAAWHCAHNPPVSDSTIFAVNVDGTYNLMEACRANGVKVVVFASSMAFGWGGVYSVTKVIGEDLWRCYHEMTGASVASLRYHDFVPKPYLAFGAKLLQNGVDARDVASATVAYLDAARNKRFGRAMSIVHTDHGMPKEVIENFAALGLDWCESEIPGSAQLIEKYRVSLPTRVEQHDLSEAGRLTGWTPKIGFREFLRDLAARDARGEDVSGLWAPGQLPEA